MSSSNLCFCDWRVPFWKFLENPKRLDSETEAKPVVLLAYPAVRMLFIYEFTRN